VTQPPVVVNQQDAPPGGDLVHVRALGEPDG
jgi:hypothetical protein